MSITTVFETIKGGLTAILTDLGEPVPEMLLGEEFLPNPGPLPSIVWVPKGAARIEPGSGMRDATSVTAARGVKQPRMLAMRHEVIHIYVRAAGFPETEKLLNHFVAAARVQLTGHSFGMESTSWGIGWPAPTEEPMREVKSGTQCILACTIGVPFTFEALRQAQPTTLTVTGEIVSELS